MMSDMKDLIRSMEIERAKREKEQQGQFNLMLKQPYFQDLQENLHRTLKDDHATRQELDKLRKKTREIGEKINEMGGMYAMQQYYDGTPLDYRRVLELQWSGIGDWLG